MFRGGGGVSQVNAALSAIGHYRGVSQLYCRKSRFSGSLRTGKKGVFTEKGALFHGKKGLAVRGLGAGGGGFLYSKSEEGGLPGEGGGREGRGCLRKNGGGGRPRSP